MGIYTTLPEKIKEVDVIIAGGGAAACVLAGRLAEVDAELSILIIERGENNYQNPMVIHPVFFMSHLAPGSKTNITYEGNKSKALAGRNLYFQSGGLLGGGSSINLCAYTRPVKRDYDSWKTEGWSGDDMIPLMKRFETYHGTGDRSVHGYNGPIQISQGPYQPTQIQDDVLQAAKQRGYKEIEDLHNLHNSNGFERPFGYVSPDGARSDSAHAYVHPKIQGGKHPNLHILTESMVVRVILDDSNRAVGVEYTSTPAYRPESESNSKQASTTTVKARKLVVVSSGAYATPLILERSGIGNPEILKKAGVDTKVDLPGVGNDYQDHHMVPAPYRTKLGPNQTIDAIIGGRRDGKKLIEENDPVIGWNAVSILSRLRPTDAEVARLGPEFQAAWDHDFKNEPEKSLMFTGYPVVMLGDPHSVPPAQYISVSNWTAYTYSRGSIHITGPKVEDAPDFETGYFSDKGDIDLKKQIWAYKLHREIIRRTQLYDGEVETHHPKFPAGSNAACVKSRDDLSSPLQDIEYSKEDDKAIEEFMRENVGTTWHGMGTCKMAPREKMGVVDPNLNVYGTKGLKVVDLSIAPVNVAANMYNVALAVGEKGSDIIVKELLGKTIQSGDSAATGSIGENIIQAATQAMKQVGLTS